DDDEDDYTPSIS
nr:Chain B, Helicase SEN1 [Saccharomyces cerevisiae S288C]